MAKNVEVGQVTTEPYWPTGQMNFITFFLPCTFVWITSRIYTIICQLNINWSSCCWDPAGLGWELLFFGHCISYFWVSFLTWHPALSFTKGRTIIRNNRRGGYFYQKKFLQGKLLEKKNPASVCAWKKNLCNRITCKCCMMASINVHQNG